MDVKLATVVPEYARGGSTKHRNYISVSTKSRAAAKPKPRIIADLSAQVTAQVTGVRSEKAAARKNTATERRKTNRDVKPAAGGDVRKNATDATTCAEKTRSSFTCAEKARGAIAQKTKQSLKVKVGKTRSEEAVAAGNKKKASGKTRSLDVPPPSEMQMPSTRRDVVHRPMSPPPSPSSGRGSLSSLLPPVSAFPATSGSVISLSDTDSDTFEFQYNQCIDRRHSETGLIPKIRLFLADRRGSLTDQEEGVTLCGGPALRQRPVSLEDAFVFQLSLTRDAKGGSGDVCGGGRRAGSGDVCGGGRRAGSPVVGRSSPVVEVRLPHSSSLTQQAAPRPSSPRTRQGGDSGDAEAALRSREGKEGRQAGDRPGPELPDINPARGHNRQQHLWMEVDGSVSQGKRQIRQSAVNYT